MMIRLGVQRKKWQRERKNGNGNGGSYLFLFFFVYEAKVWVKEWMNFKEVDEFKLVGDAPSS